MNQQPIIEYSNSFLDQEHKLSIRRAGHKTNSESPQAYVPMNVSFQTSGEMPSGHKKGNSNGEITLDSISYIYGGEHPLMKQRKNTDRPAQEIRLENLNLTRKLDADVI